MKAISILFRSRGKALLLPVTLLALVGLTGCPGCNCPDYSEAGAYVARNYHIDSWFIYGSSNGRQASNWRISFSIAEADYVDKIVQRCPPAPNFFHDLLPKAYAASSDCYCTEPYTHNNIPPANYIDSMSIRSNTAFNANYPAGTELLPLFELEQADRYYSTVPDEGFNRQNPIYDVFLPIDSLVNLGLYAPQQFQLRLLQLPELNEEGTTFNFNVYLSLSSGEELEYTLENVAFEN